MSIKHQRHEAEFVIENVLSTLISTVRREIKNGKRAPNPAALRKIMEEDLRARGWALQEIEAQP